MILTDLITWSITMFHDRQGYFSHDACAVFLPTVSVLVSHGRAGGYCESGTAGDPFGMSLSDEQALITRPLPLS